MQTHGNLTASYLWQPGELARRMLGERPAPVPPTRDLWPPPQRHPLSISTLQVAYLQDEPDNMRASTIPPQAYAPTTEPIEPESRCINYRPRVCTVGTNTDPPPTILSKIRKLIKKDEEDVPTGLPPPARLKPIPRETDIECGEEKNRTKKAINRIKKAFSGAKYRIAPGSEDIGSPKIVYDMPKPGDRMTTTFGARESRKWCKLPSRASCGRRLRDMGSCCESQPRPRRPARMQNHPPALQITQV